MNKKLNPILVFSGVFSLIFLCICCCCSMFFLLDTPNSKVYQECYVDVTSDLKLGFTFSAGFIDSVDSYAIDFYKNDKFEQHYYAQADGIKKWPMFPSQDFKNNYCKDIEITHVGEGWFLVGRSFIFNSETLEIIKADDIYNMDETNAVFDVVDGKIVVKVIHYEYKSRYIPFIGEVHYTETTKIVTYINDLAKTKDIINGWEVYKPE